MDAGKKAIGAIVTSPISSTTAVTQFKLTVGSNEGGTVSFGETSLRRRSGFYIYRPAGNPITWKLNSNVGFSAEFKTIDD